MDGPPSDPNAAFVPGRRVYVRSNNAGYALATRVGTIVGSDPQSVGSYVVRLDELGTYCHVDGQTPPLRLVFEAGDDLEVLRS